jgi:hypothetical protein
VVPVAAISSLFGRLGISKQGHHRVNMVPTSASFTKTWSAGGQIEELASISSDIPELFIGNAVMRHVRRNPATRVESNCGNWWGIAIDPSRIYTATCWVWIPAEFSGREVALSLGEWGRQHRIFADLSKRNTWQRLRATATSPPDAVQCAIVLRVEADDGSSVYSTGWQLEEGPEPTDYIATH